MDSSGTYRKASWRLATAVVLLATVLGAADWWLEIARIDDRIGEMAVARANGFTAEHMPNASYFAQSRESIQAGIVKHFKDDFPIVELYDASRLKTFEFVKPGREYVEAALDERQHGFPDGSEPYYERMDIGKDAYLLVILPFQKDGLTYGYFEGVYDVPDEAVANIRENVTRSVLMIMIAVLVTGGVLFPLLVRLNRNLLKASSDVLRGNLELLEVLGGAITYRDSDTNAHNLRVTWYSLALARAAGLAAVDIRPLIAGAFLHDIGKIGTPDSILRKPGLLTDKETLIMREHVAIGSAIISKADWLDDSREIVACHHERWDGSGYPLGLRELAIPLLARIFAIADVFDALTSRRSYKEATSPQAAMELLHRQSGHHFDPRLVELFVEIAEKVHAEVCQRPDDELEEMLFTTVAKLYGLSGRKGGGLLPNRSLGSFASRILASCAQLVGNP